MRVDNNEQRTKEINKTISKLKKLFKIRENCLLIEKRLDEVVADKATRVNNNLLCEFEENLYSKLIDFEYSLSILSNNYNNLTPFKLYQIFKICLRAINEKEFFMDTIGDTKRYDHRENIKKIEKVRKLIPTLRDEQMRTPYNPNASYNEILYGLEHYLHIKLDDVAMLLKAIYGNKRKRKIPKLVKQELLKAKNIAKSMTKVLNKGLTDAELEAKLKKVDKQFKHYK
jgi:hypothetical protein